jgi:hypothetical protein
MPLTECYQSWKSVVLQIAADPRQRDEKELGVFEKVFKFLSTPKHKLV